MIAAGTRPTFASSYATSRDKRHGPTTAIRLLDCMVLYHDLRENRPAPALASNEFTVIDGHKRHRAFFELPKGAEPIMIQTMIESTFGTQAFEVAPGTWLV